VAHVLQDCKYHTGSTHLLTGSTLSFCPCSAALQVRNLSLWSRVPAGGRQGLQLVCLCNKPSVEFLALQVKQSRAARELDNAGSFCAAPLTH